MKRDDIIYCDGYANRSYTFQIHQAKIKDKYIFTLWSFFPHNVFKECSFDYRFLANAKPENEARQIFKNIDLGELPYSEGHYFPRFGTDEEAMQFLESELFIKTYEEQDDE